ncbi:acyl carrier protein [Micromonospora sp. SD19]|uniref:acyl carrier protein n=1 Tax=Micromonospora parva TaxID=1464048 RepID=UPI00366E5F7C
MSQTQTKERLRKTLVNALRLDRDPATIPDTDLRQELDIDSIAALEFLIWVENEFGIQIDDEDLSVVLVDSLDTLAAYVDARLGATSGKA